MSAIFTAFCPSCGGAFSSEGCSVSHDVTPASPDSGIGRIVSYRRGIRRRTAVVLGHSDLGTIVIEESGSLETTQNALTDTADSAELMALASPLYRLTLLSKQERWRPALTDSLVRATCLHFRTVSTVTAGLERVVCQTCGHVVAGRTPKRRHWAVWDGRPIRIG